MSTFGQAEREEFRSNRRSLNLNLSASASCFGVLPYLLKRLSWPPCGAIVESFLSAAFSSLRLVLSRRMMSSWPSASARAISVPYRAIRTHDSCI
jgi:hypothetical protein